MLECCNAVFLYFMLATQYLQSARQTVWQKLFKHYKHELGKLLKPLIQLVLPST